jgi:hypothetical protein
MTREEMDALAASIAPIVALEVAREVIGRIGAQQEREFLDASELARVLGVERDWIYEHQEQLGAIRLSNGRRPRLRFELTRAVGALDELPAAGRARLASAPPRTPVPRPGGAAGCAADRASTPPATAVGAGYSRPVQRQ